MKNLTWTVSMKKSMIKFLSNQEIRQLSSLNMYESQSGIFMACLMYSTILQSFNLLGAEHKFSVTTVWHCCDLEIMSRSPKVLWTGKAQCLVPYAMSDFKKKYMVSEIISRLKFLTNPDIWSTKKHVHYLPWTHT